jgi:activating signal cointegrator 1
VKAITICQPYADLVLLPREDERFKRTENRTWSTRYRGPLLIHAGKSRSWIERDPMDPLRDIYGSAISGFVLGAIIGVVDMIDCLRAEEVERKYPQLRGHPHISGPYCHVYARVHRFANPIPYKGSQGFFDVPDHILADVVSAERK